MKNSTRHIIHLLLLAMILTTAGGCVYFNTFYNAKRAFSEAEDERKKTKFGQQARIRRNLYQEAIEKSLKVVENNPDSKYYDDAVYLLGVSYFYTEDYAKAERRFREILTNFPESGFARDSRLYLAKSMLQQQDEAEAMDIFVELFNSDDVDRNFKTEAALALGQYYFEQRNFDLSSQYFLAIRDSLGNSDQKRVAQEFIADGLFSQFRWSDALAAYLQILGMNPSIDQKYHALFQASVAAYRLQRISTGQDYLRTLADDELYFDSINVIRMKIAEGYEWEEDLQSAEEIYQEIAQEATNNILKAEANLKLGLIYQYDYDELFKAKDFYDEAVAASRSSDAGQEALQLSSNIGKLDIYGRSMEIDSTSTQANIDEAAYTQYQLAELFWVQLNKPDTAMIEMKYVIDSFPTAYDAPKAMIALAQMSWQQDSDSTRGDSLLQEMITRYPHSDYIPEALELLGLKGTEADTGYAGYYLEKAEKFLVDDSLIDSARANYDIIVERFPDSKYFMQARFAQIWLTEMYDAPGDSTVYYAYQEFVDSFPSSPWSQEARARLQGAPRQQEPQGLQDVDTTQAQQGQQRDPYAQGDPENAADTTDPEYDPYKPIYTDPNGERAIDLPAEVEVVDILQPFEYPSEAFVSKWEDILYFQIRLDFSGEVTDFVQKTFAPIDEINIRAQEAVQSTSFDMRLIRPEFLEKWFVYKFTVRLPDHLR